MNKTQDKKLEMYQSVRDLLLDTEPEIIDLMPMMDGYRTKLVNNVISINFYEGTQNTDRKGVTEAKDHLKIDMITKAGDVSRKVQSYAAGIKDFPLLKKVRYSESKLERVTGNSAAALCDVIYNYAKDKETVLGDYGVDAAVLLSLRKAIDNFAVSIPKPKRSIVTRRLATNALTALFFETDTLLYDEMDFAVAAVKLSAPVFWEDYFISRKLEKPSSHPLAIRFQVVDVEGTPIPGTTAVFAKNKAKFKTKQKGYFYVKNFPEGTYKVTVARMGYVTQIITVIVANGKRTDVKVVMVGV